MRRVQAWLAPAAFAAARLALAPATQNTHAIMYPVVAEVGGQNSLELFHPLYVPLLRLLHALRHGLGFPGPSLRWHQALSLGGAMLHLRLIYALAERLGASRRTALFAALLATASVNLWCWSLQTMPYTLATSAALGGLTLLIDSIEAPTRPGPSRWIVLGAVTGLAAGFDTACIVLAPVCAYGIHESDRRDKRKQSVSGYTMHAAGIYAASAFGTLAACYIPFVALGRSIPRSPSALLANLPFDIVSLARSHSPLAQLEDWLASTAPSDAPWLLLAALFAIGSAKLARGRLALAWFLGVSLFFFLADPHNRFVYAGAMLWPVVFAALGEKSGLTSAGCAAAWVLLLGKNALWRPDYLPASNLAFDEARFVASRLPPEGVLVPVSNPDLLFLYEYAGHGEVAHDGKESAAKALREGRPVWLASDSLFRDPASSNDRIEKSAGELLEALKASTGEPEISPAGQYYYPLRLKSGAAHHPPRGG